MSDAFFGQADASAANSAFNADHFHIRQHVARIRTGIPVMVIAVHGGGVGAAPTIDVQPLVNQLDSQGNSTPHGIIYGIPCTRNQGGGSAIINDPKVGDIGHAVVADRDISSLKNNAGAQSNPASGRRHNLSDMVYHSAMLNSATPTQYFMFEDGEGITLSDCNGNIIHMSAGSVQITTTVLHVVGNISATGSITAGAGGGDSVGLQTHTHPTTPAGPEASPTPGS